MVNILGEIVTIWICKILTEKNGKKYIVKTSKKSVYLNKYGWICDCGQWTSGEDENHIPLEKGQRTIYQK